MSDKQIIGLSALMAFRRSVDVIAHNVANASTPAFKAGRVQFRELLSDLKEPEGTSITKKTLVSTSQFTDFSAGATEVTGSPLDVALMDDDAFFVLETPSGQRYSRSGAFTLDATGRLTNMAGVPVATTSGQLVIDPKDAPVVISTDGGISTVRGRIASLRIARFADRGQLTPIGSGLFASAKPAAEVPAGQSRLAIGVLEKANVNQAQEMSRLMSASRAYDMLTKVVLKAESPDELRRLAGEE